MTREEKQRNLGGKVGVRDGRESGWKRKKRCEKRERERIPRRRRILSSKRHRREEGEDFIFPSNEKRKQTQVRIYDQDRNVEIFASYFMDEMDALTDRVLTAGYESRGME